MARVVITMEFIVIAVDFEGFFRIVYIVRRRVGIVITEEPSYRTTQAINQVQGSR